ncbi:MAG: hypothetical protein CNIPEHKO_02748 [Anaerolineales bacterium]|nr:hypothetical protein [Anaerolineales bacterium]
MPRQAEVRKEAGFNPKSAYPHLNSRVMKGKMRVVGLPEFDLMRNTLIAMSSSTAYVVAMQKPLATFYLEVRGVDIYDRN